jgi:hypothetical protein
MKMPVLSSVDIISEEGFKLYENIFDYTRTKGADYTEKFSLHDQFNKKIITTIKEYDYPSIGGIESRSTIPDVYWAIYENNDRVGKITTDNGLIEFDINNYPKLKLSELGNFWITGAELKSDDQTFISIKEADKESKDWIIDFQSNHDVKPSMIAALSMIYSNFIKRD